MLTEIGALVAIVKGLVDITKGGADLFGKRHKATGETIVQLKERIEGIAEQLHRSVVLSRMLPIWLKDHARVDLYTDKLTAADVKLLDAELRQLIFDSINDHFAGTLFGTSFACLPEVEQSMKEFGDRLRALEQQLNGIPPGDADAWKRTWPVVKVRMHDLRVEALRLSHLADKVHTDLINELRDASAAW